MNHTKGEWRAVKLKDKLGACTHEIQFNEDGECVTDGVYGEANAKLIAAAPNMLEALKNCENLLKEGFLGSPLQESVSKAIRKATE